MKTSFMDFGKKRGCLVFLAAVMAVLGISLLAASGVFAKQVTQLTGHGTVIMDMPDGYTCTGKEGDVIFEISNADHTETATVLLSVLPVKSVVESHRRQNGMFGNTILREKENEKEKVYLTVYKTDDASSLVDYVFPIGKLTCSALVEGDYHRIKEILETMHFAPSEGKNHVFRRNIQDERRSLPD